MDILPVPPPAVVFGLAYLPMIIVHGWSLHELIMTDRWRRFMRMSFPVALVVAALAMLLLEKGVIYAGAMLSPYIQWHVTRALYDGYISKAGRPPRTYYKRMLEGDTDDEREFSMGCALGIGVLPLGITFLVAFLMR